MKTFTAIVIAAAFLSWGCDQTIVDDRTPTEPPDPPPVEDPAEDPPPEPQRVTITFSAFYDEGAFAIDGQIQNDRDKVAADGASWELYDPNGERVQEKTELEPRFVLPRTPVSELCASWAVDLEVKVAEGYVLTNQPARQVLNVRELEPLCQVPEPLARFECFQDATADCRIRCTDSSRGEIVEWDWRWGDGFSSTAQNPTHIYAASATYNITLEVVDVFGRIDDVTNEFPIAGCP